MDKELKHELTRNRVEEAFVAVRGLLNRPDVLKPTAAVLGLVLVIGGLYYGQQLRTSWAESAFARATEVFHADVGGEATGESFKTAAEKFQKAKTMFDAVASSYGSMSAGRRARYYSALCSAELGEVAQAEELLKPIAAIRDSGAIEPAMARLRLASLALETGRAKEAAEAFAKLIADEASGLPKDRLYLGLAESLAASDDRAGARRAYTDLVNHYPQSPYAQDARTKLDTLAAL